MALKALLKIHLGETTLMELNFQESLTLKLNFRESLTLNLQETTSTRTRTSQAQLRLRGESSQTRGSPQRGSEKSIESSTGRTGRGVDSASKGAVPLTITEEYPASEGRLPSASTTSSVLRIRRWL